jgi:hypothetical protein
MSSNPSTESFPTTPASAPAAQAGGGRLIALLILLGVAIAALAYDYLYAGPGIEADDKKLEAFVDEANSQGAAKSTRLTADEIQKALGRKPTWSEKHPDEHYEIEYYCNWGRVPVLNMRRHYLAVVYVGDEPRRYNSHHKNERPPLEALPIQQKMEEDAGETISPPTSGADASKSGEAGAGEGKTGEGAPEGAPAEGAKKRKGKKKQEEKQEEKSEEKVAEPSEKAAPST